jgi:Zn-dependent protease
MTSQALHPDDLPRQLQGPSRESAAPVAPTEFPPPGASVAVADGPAPARHGLVGGLAAAGIVAAKLLTGAKAAKFLLFGATLWSIALVRPLPFAAAVIYAIFVHETGHLLAMKRCGLKTSGIWFLPFLGAVAVARQPFRSHGETYFVAIAGPVFGLLSLVPLFAAPFLFSRTYADAAAWLGYASAAAFINLFNLLPIGILDGGRIVKSLSMSLSRRLGLVVVGGGLLLCAGLLVLAGTSVLGVLLLLSIFELLRSRKMDPLPPMSRKAVFGGTALYVLLFALFAFLAIFAAAASKAVLTPGPAAIAQPDTAQGTLTDLGCAQESDLRSGSSAEPAEITFITQSTLPFSVYWLNYQGERAFYAKVPPGQSYVQKTHVANPWVVASYPGGKCLGIFRAAPSPGTAAIR